MKAVISGYGKMGHMVEASLKRRGIELVLATEDICSVPADIAGECVCIDFSTPDAFRANFAVEARLFKAVVVGTTGWYDIKDEVFSAFEKEGTPMIWASNFSIGVNAFLAALGRCCEVLAGNGYTPSVSEVHHIHKLDSPSGTAKTIASVIEAGLGEVPAISAKREGEVPGIHTAVFESAVDRIEMKHEAFSREGFAEGAVTAALMTESVSGVHEFKDLIL